jgi:hypothetical protein
MYAVGCALCHEKSPMTIQANFNYRPNGVVLGRSDLTGAFDERAEADQARGNGK